jgi:hypothetical protein
VRSPFGIWPTVLCANSLRRSGEVAYSTQSSSTEVVTPDRTRSGGSRAGGGSNPAGATTSTALQATEPRAWVQLRATTLRVVRRGGRGFRRLGGKTLQPR